MSGDKFDYLMDSSLLFFCCICLMMVTGFFLFVVSLIWSYGLTILLPLVVASYIWRKEPNE